MKEKRLDAKFRRRMRRRLYYGDMADLGRPSLPLTELAVNYFHDSATEKLGHVDVESASKIIRSNKVSPCSVVMSMLYAKRLRQRSKAYLQTMSSSDVFFISMMMASKYLYDEGVDEEVFNDEWADSVDQDVDDVNNMEIDFLNALDWRLFVRPEEFEETLLSIERRLALREGLKRGWFTYSELDVLMNTDLLKNLWYHLGAECSKLMTAFSAVYVTGFLSVLGSTALACQLSGPVSSATVALALQSPDVVASIFASGSSLLAYSLSPLEVTDMFARPHLHYQGASTLSGLRLRKKDSMTDSSGAPEELSGEDHRSEEGFEAPAALNVQPGGNLMQDAEEEKLLDVSYGWDGDCDDIRPSSPTPDKDGILGFDFDNVVSGFSPNESVDDIAEAENNGNEEGELETEVVEEEGQERSHPFAAKTSVPSSFLSIWLFDSLVQLFTSSGLKSRSGKARTECCRSRLPTDLDCSDSQENLDLNHPADTEENENSRDQESTSGCCYHSRHRSGCKGRRRERTRFCRHCQMQHMDFGRKDPKVFKTSSERNLQTVSLGDLKLGQHEGPPCLLGQSYSLPKFPLFSRSGSCYESPCNRLSSFTNNGSVWTDWHFPRLVTDILWCPFKSSLASLCSDDNLGSRNSNNNDNNQNHKTDSAQNQTPQLKCHWSARRKWILGSDRVETNLCRQDNTPTVTSGNKPDPEATHRHLFQSTSTKPVTPSAKTASDEESSRPRPNQAQRFHNSGLKLLSTKDASPPRIRTVVPGKHPRSLLEDLAVASTFVAFPSARGPSDQLTGTFAMAA